MPMKKPVNIVYVHHAVVDSDMTPKPSKVKEWGYSFAITLRGDIIPGYGWGAVGAHTKNQNSISYGISFIGDFHPRENAEGEMIGLDVPTVESLEAFRILLAQGINLGWVHPGVIVRGHRDSPVAQTSCPGDTLYSFIPYLQPKEAPSMADAPIYEFSHKPISISSIAIPVYEDFIDSTGAQRQRVVRVDQGYHILHEDGGIASLGAAKYLGRTKVRGS